MVKFKHLSHVPDTTNALLTEMTPKKILSIIIFAQIYFSISRPRLLSLLENCTPMDRRRKIRNDFGSDK